MQSAPHTAISARVTASATASFEAKMTTEERQHMILKSISQLAGVRARIDLERVLDSIRIEYVMQLRGICSQTVLIAHIERDSLVAPQFADVLVNECERRVRCPSGKHVGLPLGARRW
jgi:hypothetical protein